jgi:hypothetical protein
LSPSIVPAIKPYALLAAKRGFSPHIQPRQRRWQRGTTKIGDFPFVKGA